MFIRCLTESQLREADRRLQAVAGRKLCVDGQDWDGETCPISWEELGCLCDTLDVDIGDEPDPLPGEHVPRR